MVQFAFKKFALVDEVRREQLPNITIASPSLTVVIDGMLDSDVDVAVYHEVAAVTSNGFVLLTPENATIAAVVAEEPEVTVKV